MMDAVSLRGTTFALCPLASAPPFASPWRREVKQEAKGRLTVWFSELMPSVSVTLVEWVGADPRQPIHALVATFTNGYEKQVVIYSRVDDIKRYHVVRALSQGDSVRVPVGISL